MPCSICRKEGHNIKTCKITTPVPEPKSEAESAVNLISPIGVELETRQEMLTKIPELDRLKEVFENEDAQKGLIALYSQSQSECTKNNSCGMEVGHAREKDQAALLKLFLKGEINIEIDNTLVEDFVIGEKSKVSSKHSGSKVGSSVKAKWTSADASVTEAIKSMINAEDSYYPHLLITYLDTKSKKITIICISSEHNRCVIKSLREAAFKVPKGNSRGIEYSKDAMKELLLKKYFTIEIYDADLKGGLDPIERRMEILKGMGINP